jgi:predicted RNase H-like nuclease
VRHDRVLGVDACRAGWVAIGLDTSGVRAYAAADIDDVVAHAERDGPIRVVAIDIPIGLPDRGRRRADVLARERAGPRRSSVFMTPVRPALLAPDHAAAVEINRQLAGEGVSAQAFGLRHKLLDVARWVTKTGRHVVEAHPEVSFAQLAGRPLPTRKATWAGAEQRRQLLDSVGIRLFGDLGLTGVDASVDDVLDAAVVAWTACRVRVGDAVSLPDPPERFSDGLAAAIWV